MKPERGEDSAERMGRKATVGNRLFGAAFWGETPDAAGEVRKSVPIMVEEGRRTEEKETKELRETTFRRERREDIPRKEEPLDIEKLMGQMTKKLWEERESCGRRLR